MKRKYKILITDIQWDTDGDKRLFKKLPQKIEWEGEIDEEEDDIDEVIGDAISDQTGFCHYGFHYEILQ